MYGSDDIYNSPTAGPNFDLELIFDEIEEEYGKISLVSKQRAGYNEKKIANILGKLAKFVAKGKIDKVEKYARKLKERANKLEEIASNSGNADAEEIYEETVEDNADLQAYIAFVDHGDFDMLKAALGVDTSGPAPGPGAYGPQGAPPAGPGGVTGYLNPHGQFVAGPTPMSVKRSMWEDSASMAEFQQGGIPGQSPYADPSWSAGPYLGKGRPAAPMAGGGTRGMGGRPVQRGGRGGAVARATLAPGLTGVRLTGNALKRGAQAIKQAGIGNKARGVAQQAASRGRTAAQKATSRGRTAAQRAGKGIRGAAQKIRSRFGEDESYYDDLFGFTDPLIQSDALGIESTNPRYDLFDDDDLDIIDLEDEVDALLEEEGDDDAEYGAIINRNLGKQINRLRKRWRAAQESGDLTAMSKLRGKLDEMEARYEQSQAAEIPDTLAPSTAQIIGSKSGDRARSRKRSAKDFLSSRKMSKGGPGSLSLPKARPSIADESFDDLDDFEIDEMIQFESAI